MRRIAGHRIGVAQGDLVLVSDFDHDGPMWGGEGRRLARAHVAFEEAFTEPPAIQVAVAMWDIAGDANSRGDLRAEDVTAAGFAIAFRTWGDTRVARLRVAWTAIGPLRDDDDWDVA